MATLRCLQVPFDSLTKDLRTSLSAVEHYANTVTMVRDHMGIPCPVVFFLAIFLLIYLVNSSKSHSQTTIGVVAGFY